MTSDSNPNGLPETQLRAMISAWWDGRLSEEEFKRLQAVLRESEEARKVYFAFSSVHVGAQGAASAIGYLDLIPSAPSIGDSCQPGEAEKRRHQSALSKWGWVAVAASLAAVAVGIPSLLKTPAEKPLAPPAVIASVVNSSDGSQWSRDHGCLDASETDICAGDVIRVSQGKIQLAYVHGTVLTLHGPAVFETVSDMRGRAILGRLTASVADGAEGFSVLTPRATVVDLGTEFGIDVNGSGATDVVVFEGVIDLEYEESERGQTLRKRLHTGEAMHLDPGGTMSRIVSVRSERYSTEMAEADPGAVEAALISGVRDNIQRETSWNYYVIVPGGMREDARAFVDRSYHEWNGVTADGIPGYLLGGDYVKTFQNDKFQTDIELTVVLKEACNLYVLFDDRLPAPEWLRTRFRDTGDNIGVDVGPFDGEFPSSREFRVDVGPGKSVEDVLSVWVRRVDGPGPIRLGATESPDGNTNMYGIVATPLDPGRDAVGALGDDLDRGDQ